MAFSRVLDIYKYIYIYIYIYIKELACSVFVHTFCD